MLLFILTICCIASVKGHTVLHGNDVVLNTKTMELRWPTEYMIKATRYCLISNIIEDITAWKTNMSSRIDYNEGAVKVITTLPPDSDSNGQKFLIHPETTEEELNKIVCHKMPVEWSTNLDLDQIPPFFPEELFEVVGNETIENVETVKFKFTHSDFQTKEIRHTIWAYYCYDNGVWIPLRYEVKTYKFMLGSLVGHDIWSFSNYVPYITDDNEAFDDSQFNCDLAAVEHTPDSDKIVKELLFINPENENHVDHVYNHFQTKYERKFAYKHEQATRKDIFRENMRMIASVNRRNLGYKLAVNKFSDWTKEELERGFGIIPRPEGLTATVSFPYNESKVNEIVRILPIQYDMRLNGFISSVKDQGDCGACWAFAAADVTESGLARLNGGKVLALSNQAIIDCAYEHLAAINAGGCIGGFDYAAYNFIQSYGLPTEDDYGPYTNREDYCRIYNVTSRIQIAGYTKVPHNDFNAMKVALVNHGPLYINLQASNAFTQYSSGIFYQSNKACSSTNPNHALALVGYGEKNGNLYWILKNSWGVNWGIDGYMLIAAQDNVCGVASDVSYPLFG